MDNFEDYLSHHGILGQKWGVRNALWYPIEAYRKSKTYLESVANSEGGKKVRSGAKKAAEVTAKGAKKAVEVTAKGTKKAASATSKAIKNANEKRKAKSSENKARKAEKTEALRQKELREKEERFVKTKEEILKNGTPKDVMNIADRLTNDELNYAIERNRKLNALKDLESARIKEYNDRAHKKKWGAAIAVLNAYGSLGRSLGSVADATNNIRKFMDLFDETEKSKKERKKAKEKKLDSTSWADVLKNLDTYDSESLEYLAKKKKNRDKIVGNEKTLAEALEELENK